MDRFITIVPMNDGEAALLWEAVADGAPVLVGSHLSVDEIADAPSYPRYRFDVETTLLHRSLNKGRYPATEKDGRPLWEGARVRFTIPTHFINTVAGEGAFVALDEHGGCQILSDVEIPVYGPRGFVEAHRREVYTAVRTFEREGAIGPHIRLSSMLGDRHEHGQRETYIALDDDPRQVCTLEFDPAASPSP